MATTFNCGRDLKPYPLASALAGLRQPGTLTITMSIGQWDRLLAVAYDAGCVLLELDDDDVPVRAYRKQGVDK
jgi:hypothetical protein